MPGRQTLRAILVVHRGLVVLAMLAGAAVTLSACGSGPGARADGGFVHAAPEQPEGRSGYTPKPGWAASHWAVAAANPLATDAGYQVLKAGGSAVDAAVAVQMVLALVEPQSSGIGGGAFLLHATPQGRVDAFDGRETAPAAATEALFLGADGKPLPFDQALVGGRSVGVPGAVRMLEAAQRQHGKLPWADLLTPAITLAENGFAVSARLHRLLADDKHLKKDPVAAAYFYDAAGQPWPVGYRLKNPELAAVLRAVAAHGARALHEGPVAEAIVAKVRGHATNPGTMTLADLAAYQPQTRAALCYGYAVPGASLTSAPPVEPRQWRICGFPPPSSGGIAVGQILGILAHTPAASQPLVPGLPSPGDASATRTPSADWLHFYTEAARLAFADRAQYVADPDFVAPPGGSWHSLLAPAYLAQRARLIGTAANAPSLKTASPGEPPALAPGASLSHAPMPPQVEYGTSHISIIDGFGNALAMTTTVEDAFGARQMVSTDPQRPGGFLLNNQLTDFSFAPADAQGRPIANRVQPGKRPRSSMAPTLVFGPEGGPAVLSAGSPGGALIIHYTAKTLYGVLNWGLTPQQAIDLPNFGSLNGPSLLEEKRFAPATVQALRERGAEVREMPMTSGLQAITRAQAHGQPLLLGGADPRREGVVMGD